MFLASKLKLFNSVVRSFPSDLLSGILSPNYFYILIQITQT